MQRKTTYGKWQRRVQKALLKRYLQQEKSSRADAAAKTAQQETPENSEKQR